LKRSVLNVLGLLELRNQVYHYAFKGTSKSSSLDFLLVCKKLYIEAACLVFAATQFNINKIFKLKATWHSLSLLMDNVNPKLGFNTYTNQIVVDSLSANLRSCITNVVLTMVRGGSESRSGKLPLLFESGIKPKK
jgi:hypothetical protein